MKFSRLYIAAMFIGLIGAVGGAFAGGFISAARCDGDWSVWGSHS